MNNGPLIFVVVGTPGSGKDILIQSVRDMGIHHCRVIPKHTDRARHSDDNDEMICPGDKGHDLAGCDLKYRNYGNTYGLKLELIWDQIKLGVAQVAVISDKSAINELKAIFGGLIKLVYVHSQINAKEFKSKQKALGNDPSYLAAREKKYNASFDLYIRNIAVFDHVLIFAGSEEDLLDQIFRLFNYYGL